MAQCGCLGKTAEIAEKYLEKERSAIEGKLTSRSYDDKDALKDM